MIKINGQIKDGVKKIFLNFLTRTGPTLLLSLVLFAGGIALLALRIPGWSLLFGLPAVQIGIVFLIFTFDEIVRTKVGPESLHILPCSICGRPTISPLGQKEDVCIDCQKQIRQKSEEEI